jgi:probable H4MPT-linked C1 transfer pathway protein
LYEGVAVNRPAIGLDVGGANLKAAHSNGAARSRPFALWKNPGGLADALRALLEEMPAAEVLAVTMTGELCDCFESKRQGVCAILDAVEAAAGGMPIRVFCTDGRFRDLAAARKSPLLAAAANWLALAVFVGRYAPKGPALLIDIGSTTTDIVPLQDGRPVPQGRTDPERLRSGELVYTGVRRTPLCALLGSAGPAEWFATTLDMYLHLGWIAEDPTDHNTADGRPATKAAAEARLARMLGADLETSTAEERKKLVNRLLFKHIHILKSSVEYVVGRMAAPPRTVIMAGEGEFLTAPLLKESEAIPPCDVVRFENNLSPEISRAACAYAVAALATE